MNEYNKSIEMLWIAKSEYPAGSNLTPHSHDYYQIYYVISGEGDFIAGDKSVTLRRGMYLFTKPNDIHGISDTRGIRGKSLTMLEVKYVVFNNKFKEDLSQVPIVCKGSDNMEAMFELVYKEVTEMSSWYLQIATHLLITLLYYTIRSQRVEIANYDLQSKTTTEIKKYIVKNYNNEVTLDKISKHVSLSKDYICKTFKKNTDMTINFYLNKVRIDKAAEMLANTNMDLSEIGNSVGYNNIYHFIKTFKKFVGTSPGSFRRNELCGDSLASNQVRSISIIPLLQTNKED